MPMPKPQHFDYNADDRTSWLVFDKANRAMDGRYAMRGGICWPIIVSPGNVRGYAIVGGQHIESKVVWVFEETEFYTIDHVITAGRLEIPGLCGFFNKAWSAYGCQRYYVHQDESTCQSYRVKVHRSDRVKPKPSLIPVPWTDDANVSALADLYAATNKGKMDGDGPLFKAYQLATVQPGHQSPELHALKCLLASFERFPYRKQREE